MNDKYFLDTNILVYSFDQTEPPKNGRSKELIADALGTGNGMISWQVVQEFLSFMIRKSLFSNRPRLAKEFLQTTLEPLCQIFPDLDLYSQALDVQFKSQYSFYDSLIIVSARKGECGILYSEDLHDGQRIEELTIVNPFRK